MEEVVLEKKCMACGGFCDRRAPGKVICLSCDKKLKPRLGRPGGVTERPMGVDEFAKRAGSSLRISDFPENLRPYVEARVGQTLVRDGKRYLHKDFAKSNVGSANGLSSKESPCRE